MEYQGHTVLLGGIGGDAHSVGLTILRQSLLARGYRVHYLGTQNRLEDFFHCAPLANVVMISSMDGHGHYYLRGFADLMKQFKLSGQRWYLGGNLHIGTANGYAREFREMGFDQVFAEFVDIKTVLGILERDLAGTEPTPDCLTLFEQAQPLRPHLPASVSDEQLGIASFERQRQETLEHWHTGRRAANLSENAEFLARQPAFPALHAQRHAQHLPLIVQPRSGVPLVPQQINIFKALREAGAHVLSYQVDSLTRNNNYVGADEAIRESRAASIATVNGFPVVNHGVDALRRIITEVATPLQVRHSTRDPRLLAEISYAGGVTAFEGGAICYNIPYYKDYPLDQSILTWQYVDRLTGLYYERFGIKLDREFFGTLTATLIPPCLAIAVNIIETLLAVQQGVKCVSLGYAEQGHRTQDIAAIQTMGEMAAETLGNLGYKDIQINTVFHQYMAAFPTSPRRAEELIYNSAVTAALSGATRIITKTPYEAVRIPTLADNLHGLSLVLRGVDDAARATFDAEAVAAESDIIRREVRSLLDGVIMCGGGDIATGVVAAFRRGLLDIPFAPSLHSRGEALTARDGAGAVRFLACGSLPFDRELRAFHREKMNERRSLAGHLAEAENYLLVEQDVLQVTHHNYERWPLHS